ncbi:MAG: metalloregulator ArsR/SmtB family transcription factor [Luteimonas sp.]|nr:metalloregulator ArsR/SmtB family transcription factor [Luteimonas sp.]
MTQPAIFQNASGPLEAAAAGRMRQRAGEAAILLRVLANEQRLRVLCRLVEGECSVGCLLDELDLSQSALSQHLAVLREAGVVATRREGQSVKYRLVDGPARPLMATLHDIFCTGD